MSENPSQDLVALGKALGTHPSRLTLHWEGSCAVKTGDAKFLVSARGALLSKLTAATLVEAQSKKLLASIESEEDEKKAEEPEEPALELDQKKPNPSEDAAIYAYLFTLDGVRFAARTQPIEVSQILCSPRARQFSDRRTYHDEILACGASSVLIPYTEPGLPLAREVKRKIILWRDRNKIAPKLLLLQNYGMMVLGKSREEVARTTDMAVKAAQIFTGAAMLGGPVFLSPDNVVQIESAARE